MNKQTLDTLRVWFSAYTQTFHTDDKEIQSEVSLKECHTIRVVEHCHNLAAWLRFNTKDIYLAEAVGLCHDIGRFKQVTQYRTINDIESVDHAALGVAEMIAANIPNKVESADWEILLTCTEKLNQSLCEFFFPMLFDEFARSFVLQAAMWPEVVILPSPSLDLLPGFRHGTKPVFI